MVRLVVCDARLAAAQPTRLLLPLCCGAQVREHELQLIRKTAVVKTLNLCLVFAVPPTIALVIFATYAYSVGPLTSSMAFVVRALGALRPVLVAQPHLLPALPSCGCSCQNPDRASRPCLRAPQVLSLFNTLRFPLVVLPKALRGASGMRGCARCSLRDAATGGTRRDSAVLMRRVCAACSLSNTCAHLQRRWRLCIASRPSCCWARAQSRRQRPSRRLSL